LLQSRNVDRKNLIQKVDNLPDNERFKKLKEENAILQMLHDAENIITDSLLEPIGSIILRSLIITECEEKQKVQTAKLQASYDHKLASLKGENEKLNAEMRLLREQDQELKKLKEELKIAAEEEHEKMIKYLDEIDRLNSKHRDQLIEKGKQVKAAEKLIENQRRESGNEVNQIRDIISHRDHATGKKIKEYELEIASMKKQINQKQKLEEEKEIEITRKQNYTRKAISRK
jgi:chromosome segregation ATPase